MDRGGLTWESKAKEDKMRFIESETKNATRVGAGTDGCGDGGYGIADQN